jgi:iron complex outermembrane receptor protein
MAARRRSKRECEFLPVVPDNNAARLAFPTILMLAVGWSAVAEENSPLDLVDLSLEDLGNIQITSVSKRMEPMMTTAASVFVITRDDIVRSGVTSIPEALRLAPGVEVARRNAHAWSISIRGFNRDLANKLLVLIDGRSVYSPLYAGVFWDAQDTLLEDVERIEVISGPGGTIWGANAVNGVINIITRSAADTAGTYAEVGGGVEERGFAGFRYGRELGDSSAVRTYVKYFDRDSSELLSGEDAADDWQMARAGFRADWQRSTSDQFRLQGDIYRGEKTGEFLADFTVGTLPSGTFRDEIDFSGGNILLQWKRQLKEGADFRFGAYYDRTHRDIPNTYDETRDTLDADFQHHFTLGERHDLLWGLAFRLTSDDLENTIFATFEPASRTDRTYSLFLQDRIELREDRLDLTAGSKFEVNDYTDFEWQPNVRLTWQISDRQASWFAVSRAVRIPSRLDADLRLTAPLSIPTLPFPVYITVNGSDAFESEELMAYESGYRLRANDRLYFDVSAFYNEYDHLQTTEPEAPVLVLPSHILLPNALANNMHGESRGGTLTLSWQAAETWRLRFNYAYLDLSLRNSPASQDVNSTTIAGNSPRHQFAIFSFLDFLDDFSLYTAVRYVDELPALSVDNYIALDLSLRWQLADHFTLSLTGRSLEDSGHAEFGPGVPEVERAVFAKLAWEP